MTAFMAIGLWVALSVLFCLAWGAIGAARHRRSQDWLSEGNGKPRR